VATRENGALDQLGEKYFQQMYYERINSNEEDRMAHDVRFTVTERDLENSPVVFRIKRDGKVVGTLEISKGGLTWYSRKKQYGPNLSWAAFDKLMQDEG
jgi:hypothetical protein